MSTGQVRDIVAARMCQIEIETELVISVSSISQIIVA